MHGALHVCFPLWSRSEKRGQEFSSWMLSRNDKACRQTAKSLTLYRREARWYISRYIVNPSCIYLSAMGCLWLLDDCCGLSSVRQMRVIVKPPSFSPRFPVFLPDKLSARLDFASSYIWPRCIVSPFVTSSHCQNKNPASQNSGRKIKTIGTAEAK